MSNHSFLRHAATYGLASLLLQAAGFVLLPLYTRHLSPGDFGLLEVLGRTAEIFMTCLLLTGIRQGVVTLHEQATSPDEGRQIAGAAYLVMLAACVLGGAGVLLFARPLTHLFDAGQPSLVLLATLAAVLEVFWLVPLTLTQTRMESGRYLLVTLSQFFVRVIVTVVLVAWCEFGVAGVLGGMALTSGLYALLLSGGEMSRGIAWPTPGQVRALVSFAVPFLPGGLCFLVIHYADRYFLLHWHGREEVGIYGLGYKLALAVGTLSLNPLQMVWGVQMYREAKSKEAPALFGRAFTRIIAAYLYVGLGLCLLQEEVIEFLGGDAYRGATAIVAPIVLAGLFQSAAALMDAGLYVRRRTGLKLGLTASATVVTLMLYSWLIPAHAGIGAAWATVGGFAFLAVATWWTSQRVFAVEYEWGRLLALGALAAGVWLTAATLPSGPFLVAAKFVLAAVWPVLAWQLGLVSNQEKQYLRRLLGEMWKRVWPRRRPSLDADELLSVNARTTWADSH